MSDPKLNEPAKNAFFTERKKEEVCMYMSSHFQKSAENDHCYPHYTQRRQLCKKGAFVRITIAKRYEKDLCKILAT